MLLSLRVLEFAADILVVFSKFVNAGGAGAPATATLPRASMAIFGDTGVNAERKKCFVPEPSPSRQ
jgi:hypothetical protein